eukprot:SAG22_NODE_2478_length_2529_cov_6.910700_2_plen_97_part_00
MIAIVFGHGSESGSPDLWTDFSHVFSSNVMVQDANILVTYEYLPIACLAFEAPILEVHIRYWSNIDRGLSLRRDANFTVVPGLLSTDLNTVRNQTV